MTTQGSAGQSEVETLSLTLLGRPGTIVTASLTLENLLAHRSKVTCAMSEFRKTDGTGHPFRAQCEIEPTELWLEPGETRTTTVRLNLSPDVFPIGQLFAATLLIHGGGEEDTLVFIRAGATVD